VPAPFSPAKIAVALIGVLIGFAAVAMRDEVRMNGLSDFYFVTFWQLLIIVLAMLAFIVIVTVPSWVIFRRAGFDGTLGILMVIPLVNVALLYVLAFSAWKTVLPRVE
jgi:hypothetical protein